MKLTGKETARVPPPNLACKNQLTNAQNVQCSRHYLVESKWKWDSISQHFTKLFLSGHMGALGRCAASKALKHGECKRVRLLWTCESLCLECTAGKSWATVTEKGIDRCYRDCWGHLQTGKQLNCPSSVKCPGQQTLTQRPRACSFVTWGLALGSPADVCTGGCRSLI